MYATRSNKTAKITLKYDKYSNQDQEPNAVFQMQFDLLTHEDGSEDRIANLYVLPLQKVEQK